MLSLFFFFFLPSLLCIYKFGLAHTRFAFEKLDLKVQIPKIFTRMTFYKNNLEIVTF